MPAWVGLVLAVDEVGDPPDDDRIRRVTPDCSENTQPSISTTRARSAELRTNLYVSESVLAAPRSKDLRGSNDIA